MARSRKLLPTRAGFDTDGLVNCSGCRSICSTINSILLQRGSANGCAAPEYLIVLSNRLINICSIDRSARFDVSGSFGLDDRVLCDRDSITDRSRRHNQTRPYRQRVLR